MHGSEAEVRIRDKVVALLRECLPDARIIHEFDLWGVRMDLAAVTPEEIVLVEIKSERDKLDRLANQVRFAAGLGGEVWVCYHEKWIEPIRLRCQSHDMSVKIPIKGMRGAYNHPENPLYIPALSRCEHLTETPDGPLKPDRFTRDPRDRRYRSPKYDNRRLLSLIHKPEVLALAKPHGGKSRMNSSDLIELCHEHLTGAEIRRGVLAHIRAHPFFWADPPVPLNADQPQGPST